MSNFLPAPINTESHIKTNSVFNIDGHKKWRGANADNNHIRTIIMKKTNRKDISINTNSSSINFKFSVVTSRTLPLNQRISLEGGELKVTTCPQFEGSVEVINCRGTTHLGQIIENLGCYQAIIPGCMHRDGKWVKRDSICWINPDLEYYEPIKDNAQDYFGIMPGAPSLYCLDIPNVDDTPGAVRERLCESFPPLQDVGFVMVPSTSSYIRDKASGMLLTAANGYRFYFLAKINAEILGHGTAFAMQSVFDGFNRSGHMNRSGELPDQSITVKA